ncbi:MAG: nickel pincer cofactor biosynthesis protein LarC [Clostridia bacterium]|nr:nickel pincer cofactor biosynthesis protein LarC [Clostridia bacterium]
MKTLYLDCSMGAAGDMLTAALAGLTGDREKIIDELNAIGIPGVVYDCRPAEKCGIKGLSVTVKVDGREETEDMHEHEHHHDHDHDHEHEHHHDHDHDHDHEHEHHHDHDHEHEHHHDHHHSGMHEITHIVEKLPVSEKVRKDVLEVYSLIAEAESDAHGVPVSQIHFHEVGSMDAVADITAVCMLMERLAPDRVVVSPINTGSGRVRCAHGILPVPAPATAYILKDVPVYAGEIRSELCTPTGAALLKHFATSFSNMPLMKPEKVGYGMGKKDFEAANCVRAILGETGDPKDIVIELSCNLDDMTAEAVAFAEEQFFAAGAVEVYTVPVQMKKSRPGVLLSVMCREKDRDDMIRLIFKHTTTLGVRENISRRYTLSRSIEKETTKYGEVRKKVSSGYGVRREKYEYEDLAGIAREHNKSLAEVLADISEQEKEK